MVSYKCSIGLSSGEVVNQVHSIKAFALQELPTHCSHMRSSIALAGVVLSSSQGYVADSRTFSMLSPDSVMSIVWAQHETALICEERSGEFANVGLLWSGFGLWAKPPPVDVTSYNPCGACFWTSEQSHAHQWPAGRYFAGLWQSSFSTQWLR